MSVPNTKAKSKPDLTPRIQKLEEDLKLNQSEIKVLQSKIQQEQEENSRLQAEAAQSAKFQVGAGDDGFFIADPEQKYRASLGTITQIIGKIDLDGKQPNAISFRRLRLKLGFKLKFFSFNSMIEFAQGKLAAATKAESEQGRAPAVTNAEGEFNLGAVKIRAGYGKTGFDLEILRPANALIAAERGYSSVLSPNRDFKYPEIAGESSHVDWSIALHNGALDNNAMNSPVKLHRGVDSSARLIFKPFATLKFSGLRNLALGVAATLGTQLGEEGNPVLPTYRSVGFYDIFTYRKNETSTESLDPVSARANGLRWRLQPQVSFFGGPVSVLASGGLVDQAVKFRSHEASLRHYAWGVQASFIIGGKASFQGPSVNKPLGWKQARGPGALELHGRATGIHFDKDSFPIYADPEKSVSKATSFGGGTNWWLNKNLALKVNFDHTIFRGGDADGGDRASEDVLTVITDIHF